MTLMEAALLDQITDTPTRFTEIINRFALTRPPADKYTRHDWTRCLHRMTLDSRFEIEVTWDDEGNTLLSRV